LKNGEAIVKRVHVGLAVALAAASAMAWAGEARAQANFYAGKQINYYIGYGAGGGFDLYARLLAKHIGTHIPGKPTVVPQNMPGAGGLKSAGFMYSVAPKDGLSLCTTGEGTVIDQVLNTPGADYKPAEFNWIGMMTPHYTIFFTWHTSPSKTFADVQKRETVFGSLGSGSTDYLPRVLNKLAGAKFKLITGYRGSADVLLAVEREEVEAGFGLWQDIRERKADWIAEKKINPIIFLAPQRIPEYPDVPLVNEVAITPEGKQILDLFAHSEVGKSVFTTPGVAADRVALLRKAFDETLADPAFRADAQKSNVYLEPMGGQELQKYVERIVSVPKDVAAKAEEARK
jgi:tripartite-type tricarboxylate transporter receptor subunit TctC